jgi:hypothetical protein
MRGRGESEEKLLNGEQENLDSAGNTPVESFWKRWWPFSWPPFGWKPQTRDHLHEAEQKMLASKSPFFFFSASISIFFFFFVSLAN